MHMEIAQQAMLIYVLAKSKHLSILNSPSQKQLDRKPKPYKQIENYQEYYCTSAPQKNNFKHNNNKHINSADQHSYEFQNGKSVPDYFRYTYEKKSYINLPKFQSKEAQIVNVREENQIEQIYEANRRNELKNSKKEEEQEISQTYNTKSSNLDASIISLQSNPIKNLMTKQSLKTTSKISQSEQPSPNILLDNDLFKSFSQNLKSKIIPLIPLICDQKKEINIFKQNMINSQSQRKEDRYKGYFIEQQLGMGKYSIVYLARHIETNFRVALKVIQKKQIIDEQMEMQLTWEIKIQYLLRSPNIVQLYSFFKTNTEIVLVLEYCPGGHLLQYMKRLPAQKLAENEAQKYVRQVISALSLLHNSEILHRDIKPENILLSYGNAKLADFSFCVYSPHEYRRTQCGTLIYLSPEVTSGDLYDKKSDLWGIGILAYELCFGETPWCDLDRNQQMEAIKMAQIKFPQNISRHLKDFIQKLLKRIPRERMTCKEALLHPWLKDDNLKESLFIKYNKQLLN